MRDNLKLDQRALEKNRELMRLAKKMQKEVLESMFLARRIQQIYHQRLRDCPACNRTQTNTQTPKTSTGTQTGTGTTTTKADCNCGLKGTSTKSGK
jgi:hypothetical protein